MRRGLINKSTFLFIFFVALFTILSYGFDQMVIRTEDKIRNLNIEYQNINNNLTKHQSIATTLNNISIATDLNFSQILLNRNLLIKSYLLSSIELKGTLDFFNRKSDKVNSSDLGRMICKELIKVVDIQQEIRSQYVEFYITNEKYLKKINKKQFSLLSKLYQVDSNPLSGEKSEFFNQDLTKYTKLIGYERHWKDNYKGWKDYRQKAFDNFTSKEWYDVYRYKMVLLKQINDDTEILDDFLEKVDLMIENEEEKLINKFDLVKSASVQKNYFILLSIISQIFSLLFLLLLFRSFIIKIN